MSFNLRNKVSNVQAVIRSMQESLDAYAATDSPAPTGTVSGITPAMLGLGNLGSTRNANKPISTATQAALASSVATLNTTAATSSSRRPTKAWSCPV